MHLKIAGTFWEIRLLTPSEFISTHGEGFNNAAAVTDVIKKIVDFRTDDLSEIHVRHETFHMYADTQLIKDSNLDMEQFEENAACLMGRYGEEYIKNSRKITKWLKKELQRRNK